MAASQRQAAPWPLAYSLQIPLLYFILPFAGYIFAFATHERLQRHTQKLADFCVQSARFVQARPCIRLRVRNCWYLHSIQQINKYTNINLFVAYSKEILYQVSARERSVKIICVNVSPPRIFIFDDKNYTRLNSTLKSFIKMLTKEILTY